MALSPVSAGQLISAAFQNFMVSVVNRLLAVYAKKGDIAVGAGPEAPRTLSIPDGVGKRAVAGDTVTKQNSYERFQPEIPQQDTPPSNPQVGDLWNDTS